VAIEREYFTHIHGTTDSELMFYLALTFGLKDDPLGALERMAGFVERTAAEHGVKQALWMTLGVTDGQTIYAVRYASDGKAPTLFHSRDVEDLYHHNPRLREFFSKHGRAIVSEPTSGKAAMWAEVPQSSAIVLHDGEVINKPFRPA
jgi:predicted glutamine amidotransferase